MSAETAYLDTSAFLKLLVVEPESAALRAVLEPWTSFASATLLVTETTRALRRSGNGQLIGRARRLFGAVHLIRLDEPLLDRAGELQPGGLRSLDAIHLAAALSIESELGAIITYDARLADAASAAGIPVCSPGMRRTADRPG